MSERAVKKKKVAARRGKKKSYYFSCVSKQSDFRMVIIEDEGRNCMMDLQKEKKKMVKRH